MKLIETMKYLLLTIIFLFISNCSSRPTIIGKTVARDSLAKDTYALIVPMAKRQLECERVESVEVITSNVFLNGKAATEIWLAKACGKSQPYTVSYFPSPRGGVMYNVSPITEPPMPPILGKTSVKARLATDTYMALLKIARAHLSCEVLEVEVSESLLNGQQITEKWTAIGCGKSQIYKVDFSPSSNGSYTFKIESEPNSINPSSNKVDHEI
ncbi:hypothetical protein EHQ52_14890 [Leptospira koniambonensis]|uniref:Uncharacterized protein n=1 Tax=Leptospira koniambonensis TaxID=2484950 RepID=A0A4R9J4P5_9LEPT|nr:hypothetical protein [Leptospira koniambonensis]TGL32566.1 hypothetical protein EHQ52_14890 [Leptospira koniambonensis]